MKKIFWAVIISVILILSYGIYLIFNIYYSNYFSQTTYVDTTFINFEKVPTKFEILFWGFKDFRIILTSVIVSIIIILIKTRSKKNCR